MIKIDKNIYINKDNIAYITEEDEYYIIVMTNNKKFICYSWEIVRELINNE